MTVAIVGAGAAGLQSALFLQELGAKVQLFEARNRIGGRIFTVREEGLAYDAGGEWIDADHTRVLTLAADLGIELLPSGTFPRDIYFGGQHCTEMALWSDALEDDLRLEAFAKEHTRDLDPIPWNNTLHLGQEHTTMAEVLREVAQSPRGLWWLGAQLRSDEGDDPERIGLLGWLVGYKHYLDREEDVMSAYRLKGGMDLLTQGMAGRLSSEAKLEHILRRVEQSGRKVTLQFDQGKFIADHVVVALPPRAVERVVFDPPLSTEKRCAIEACGMSRIVKVCLEFETAWWRELPSRGSIHTDGALQQLWDGSHGERAILTAYVCGAEADTWVNNPAAIRRAHAELVNTIPRARDSKLISGKVHDWTRDEFSFGGFSHLGPGYVLEHMENIAPPEGRVHFAGEHSALWTGFIEGALESAERVRDEIAR